MKISRKYCIIFSLLFFSGLLLSETTFDKLLKGDIKGAVDLWKKPEQLPRNTGVKTLYNKSDAGTRFVVQPKDAAAQQFFLPGGTSKLLEFRGHDKNPQLASITAINPDTNKELYTIKAPHPLLNASTEIALTKNGFIFKGMMDTQWRQPNTGLQSPHDYRLRHRAPQDRSRLRM